MNKRKRLIRKLVLGLLLRENANEIPRQYSELKSLLAEALARHAGIVNPTNALSAFSREHQLEGADATILLEVFWDFVVEKVITLGLDDCNPTFPWFRLHSEALENLKKQTSNP